MKAPNHVVGGVVFTGVFGGICGVNILQEVTLIVLTIFASLLPDVDHPKSIIGKLFKPISVAINKRHGHRTITHSLFMLLGLTLLAGLIESNFSESKTYTLTFCLAYLSHLLFDMMTLQGVPLLYPYKKNPCVIPADPRARLRTNDNRAELGVFIFFIVAGVFMQPLMSNGFWTSYNRLFGTMKHVYSEFRKSDDLLRVDYSYRVASEKKQSFGFLIEATESRFVMLGPNATSWEVLDKKEVIVEGATPTHTNRRFTIHKKPFVNMPADTLNVLLRDRLVLSLETQGNESFETRVVDVLGDRQLVGEELVSELLETIHFSEIPDAVELEQVTYIASPRIETLKKRLSSLRSDYQADLKQYEADLAELAQMRENYGQTGVIYDKQKLLERIQEKTKRLKEPIFATSHEADLIAEIQELRATDLQNYSNQKSVARREYQLARSGPLLLTGIFTYVTLD